MRHRDQGRSRSGTIRRLSAIAATGVVAIATATAFAPAARADEPVTVKVCAFDSAGNPITLGSNQAWIQPNGGSINYVGAVGTSGCRESTVAGGTSVATWVAKEGTYSSHHVAIAESGTLEFDFYTTNVTIQYPGGVAFGGAGGDSGWFKQTAATASRELFADGSNPTMFRLSTPAGYARTPVSWPEATGPGASKTFSLMAMQVKDNAGVGEAGATATYSPNQYANFVPGSTGSDGLLAWADPRLDTTVSVTARVNGTTATQSYDASTQRLLTFQTTNLTLHYNGQIRYFFNGVNAAYFTGGSMELFAGSYTFDFRSDAATGNPGTVYTATDITIPGPASGPVTKSAAVVRFQNSTGAGLVGSVSYYKGGWVNAVADTDQEVPWSHLPATPGGPGSAVVLFDGAPTSVVFALSYAGERQQLATQNIQTSSVAYFHTTDVTLSLRDHTGAALDTGDASYYATSWHTVGQTESGDVHLEMLPGTYSFAMTYLGTRNQVSQNIATNPQVVFTTGQVVSDTATAYYASGWQPFTSGQEMLSGSYTFSFSSGPNALEPIVGGTVNTIP